MKQEASKKSKKWLWLAVGILVVLAAVGVVLAFVLGGGQGDGPAEEGPKGGRPAIYWNIDREIYLEEDTGMSAREPEGDGNYYITFAFDGQQVKLPIVDKQLVNYIDTMDAMGLVMDADGMVIDAVDVNTIATEMAKGFVVQSVTETTLTLDSSLALNGMEMIVNKAEVTKTYMLTEKGEFKGAEVDFTDLEPMDTVTVYGNDLGEATHVAVVKHPIESPVYWRVERFYNSSLKASTRVPDENGYYSIEFFVNGERVTLQTNDVAIANYVDKPAKYSCHSGYILDENGYIIAVQSSAIGIRGILACSLYEVTEINGDTFTATKQMSGKDVGQTYTNTVDENCKIYDVSEAPLPEDRGKETKLQLGDRIVVFEDTVGKPMLIYVSNRLVDSPMYFNLTRSYNSTLKETKRTPDANGWYTIEMLVNGEVKTLHTKDKAIMTRIDMTSDRSVGLQLNGDVIERVFSADAVTGYISNVGYYVTSVTSIVMSTENTVGTAKSIIMNANCKTYNVSGIGGKVGSETTVQEGDYTIINCNAAGEAMYIWVLMRKVDFPVYYSMERKYKASEKTTTRVPDEDGWYVYDVACDGKRMKVKTKDKALATKVDSYTYPVFSLDVRNGIIYDAFPANAATGGQKQASGYTYNGVNEDGTLSATSSSGLTTIAMKPAEGMKIYNVSYVYDKFRGEVGTLQKGDIIQALTNRKGETVMIFIVTRDFDSLLYWHTDRQYNSELGETTREPNADGWYIFEMAVEGEVKTFKTKDKDVASQVDAISAGMALRLKGDVILGALSAVFVDDVKAAGPIGKWISTKGNKLTVYHTYGDLKDTEGTYTIAKNVRIFDMTGAGDHIGVKTELQKGDVIRTYVNADGELLYIIVTSGRKPKFESPMYWKLDRFYDGEKKETTRVPDAEGWYIYQMAVDGEIKTFKTNDKKVATSVDAQSGGVALKLRGDVIQQCFSALYVTGVEAAGPMGKVTEVGEKEIKMTFTTGDNKGTNGPMKLAADCKIFDISTAAETFGCKTTLKKGDSLRTYVDAEGNLLYIWVLSRAGASAGYISPMYWKLDRFYDSEKKETTRVPDADGWYVYQMAVDGEIKTFKTKDKAVATSVDAQSGGVALKLDGDIILQCNSALFVQGVDAAGPMGKVVSAGTQEVVMKFTTGDHAGEEGTVKIAEGCKIFDISAAAESFGCKTTLKKGDSLRTYVNIDGELVYIWVTARAGASAGFASPMYWKLDRFYDSENKVTTRVPDADGWYVYQMAVDGEIVTLKTKDKAVATAVDSQSGGNALKLDGNIILASYSALYAQGVDGVGPLGSVTKVDGNKITVKYSSGENKGKETVVTLAADVKVFNITSAAKQFGEKTTIQVKDSIRSYVNIDGELLYVYITSRGGSGAASGYEASLYWKLDRFYDSEKKETTRVPDADGWYVYQMAVDGKIVTLKTKDKKIATAVDSQSGANCLKLDGDIIVAAGSALASGVVDAAGPLGTVTKVDGNKITVKYSSGDNKGKEGEEILAADVKVFNITSGAKQFGEKTTVQVKDGIRTYVNGDGELAYVYITSRGGSGTSSDGFEATTMYWKMDRQYDSTNKVTTRTPDKDGWYVYKMAVDGQIVTLKTKDKKIATAVDSQSGGNALKLDGDIILASYSALFVKGVEGAGALGTVTKIDGNKITVKYSSGDNKGKEGTETLAADVKVFNVNSSAKQFGEKTTIQVKDGIRSYVNADGELLYVYITSRGGSSSGSEATFESPLYWHVERQYDGDNKVTTRTPDADGWYYLTMAVDGQIKTFKTKDKAAATSVDAQGAGIALHLDGDIIVKGYSALYVTGVAGVGPLGKFVSQDGNKVTVEITSGELKGTEGTYTLAENGKIFDMYAMNDKFGSVTELKKGDSFRSYVNADGELLYVVVTSRSGAPNGFISPIYWKLDRFYDSDNGVTLREPDADGYYVYDVAVNGEIKTLKTKSKSIANAMDSQKAAMGLWVDGDIIKGAYSALYATGVTAAGPMGTVKAVNGNEITITYTSPADKAGQDGIEKLAASAGVYDISEQAISFGEITTVRVGDKLRTYVNEAGELLYVYVQNRAVPRVNGNTSLCDHCGQIVDWVCWSGDALPAEDGHYYLGSDTTAGGVNFGAGSTSYDVCIDLNGKTLRNTSSRAFVVWTKLTVMDSVGSGKIVSYGAKDNKGGVALVGAGGEFTLLSGSLELAETHANMVNGGVISATAASSIVNIKGGSISGGVTANGEDNIYMAAGTLNISGGTIDGGVYMGATATGTVSGKVMISNKGNGLTMAGVNALTVDNLAADSEIYVNANGVFTTKTENADQYLDNFKAAVSGKAIVVENENYLACSLDNSSISDKFESGTTMALCPVCGEVVEWSALSAITENTALEDGKHYYLTDNLSNEGVYTIPSGYKEQPTDEEYHYTNVTVHLNGYNITGTGMVFSTGTRSTLNLLGEGTVSGGAKGNAATIYSTGTLNLYGGTYTHTGTAPTLTHLRADGVVNMYSGAKFVGTEGATGTHVNVPYGAFNMFGGSISGGSAVAGDKTDGKGANVAIGVNTINTVTNAQYHFNMYGGNIDGGVYVATVGAKPNNFSFTVSGNSVITGKDGGLTIEAGKLLTLGTLGEDASIVVTADGTFTTAMADANSYLTKITASSTKDQIVVEAVPETDKGVLVYNAYKLDLNTIHDAAKEMNFSDPMAMPTTCPICDGTVIWMPLPEATGTEQVVLTSGHYYVAADMLNNTVPYQISGEVCLNLNGKNISCTGSILNVPAGSKLNVMGDGVLTSANESEIEGVEGSFYNKGTMNLFGGTYTNTNNKSNIFNHGKLAIYKGTVVNSTTAKYNVQATSGHVTIAGGTFTGKNVRVAATGTLTLSGAPVISKLDVTHASFTVAEIVDLDAAADITIIAKEGVFTSEVADPQAILGCFTAGSATMKIEVQGNALAYLSTETEPSVPETSEPEATTEATTEPAETVDYNGVYAAANAMSFADAQNLPTTCPICGDNVTWTVLPAATGDNNVVLSGHYYVAEDLTNTKIYEISDNACVHLNGKNITSADNVFFIAAGGTLNVMGQGEINGCTEARTYEAVVMNKGVVNLCGGTYMSSNNTVNAMTVHGTSNVYNGAVFNAADGKYNIQVPSGHLYMAGGTTIGKMVRVAGTGTMTMSGAPNIGYLWIGSGKTIEIDQLDAAAQIKVVATGVFTGEIADVNAVAGCFTASEATKEVAVQGNTLAVVEKETEATTEATTVPETTEATEPAETVDYNGVNAAANAMSFADAQNLPTTCPICDGAVEWTALPEATGTENKVLAAGHYYVAGEMNNTKIYVINEDVCIHLNGQTVNAADSFMTVLDGKTANLMGAGVVNANTSAANTEASILVKSGATLNVCGGTYTCNQSDKNVMTVQSTAQTNKIGVANIYNGSVFNAPNCKYNIQVPSGVLNVYGGEFTGKMVRIAGTGSVKLSGAPKMSYLYFGTGLKAEIVDLDAAAEIKVLADGVFTQELADANALLGCFDSVALAKEIVVEGNALSCVEKPTEGSDPSEESSAPTESSAPEASEPVDYNTVYAEAKTMSFADAQNLPTTCPICDGAVEWTVLPAANGTENTVLSGHYYAAEDLENTKMYDISGTVCLHLNGKTVTSTNTVFSVASSATLNVMGDGNVSGSTVEKHTQGGVIYNKGTLNLCGGTYTRPEGCISNNIVTQHGDMGMYNGTVLTTALTTGYNIRSTVGHLTLAGGTSTGRGIRVAGTSVTGLTVTGAPNLSNLDLTYGFKATVVDLDPAAQIMVDANGCFTEAITDASVVTCFSALDPYKAVVLDASALHIVDAPDDINLVAPQALAMDFSDAENLPTNCPYCDNTNAEEDVPVVWTALTAISEATELPAGHYYVPENLSNAATCTVAEGASVCLHLNGKTVESTGTVINLGTGRTLNVMGEGTVIGAGTENAATLLTKGTLNTFGGTFKHAAASKFPSVVTTGGAFKFYEGTVLTADEGTVGTNLLINGGTFHMYGGEISNGTAAAKDDCTLTGCNWGGNILVKGNDADTTFFMYGGKVFGGTAENGANIGIPAHFPKTTTINVRLCSGEIYGGTASHRGGNIYVLAGATGDAHSVTFRIGDKAGDTPIEIYGGNARYGGNVGIAYSAGTDEVFKVMLRHMKVYDGVATENGGNFFIENAKNATGGFIGTLGFEGCTAEISNGKAVKGGNIYFLGTETNAKLDTAGLTIRDGVATEKGGNVVVMAGTVTLTGATISGGTAGEFGNDVYVASTATFTETSGTAGDVYRATAE